jgi:hypothetical protein
VNQLAQHALVGETLQVGAGLTEPAPDAFDVPDPETLSDKGVQVDAAGDDVASSLRIPELVAVGRGEFVEHFGLDKRQVVTDAVPAAWGEGRRLAYRSPSRRTPVPHATTRFGAGTSQPEPTGRALPVTPPSSGSNTSATRAAAPRAPPSGLRPLRP